MERTQAPLPQASCSCSWPWRRHTHCNRIVGHVGPVQHARHATGTAGRVLQISIPGRAGVISSKKHPAGQAPCATHTHTQNARTEHASFPNVATLLLAQTFKRSMSDYGAWSTFQRCIHRLRNAHLHPEKFIIEPNGSHSTHFTEAFSQTSLPRATSAA